MWLWGEGRDVIELGTGLRADCRHCARAQPFRNVLVYRYLHVWFLFCWVTHKRYVAVCEGCRRGREHDTRTFERTLARSPIPFYRRFGGLVLLAMLLLVLAAVVAADRRAERAAEADQAAWLSASVTAPLPPAMAQG